MALQFQPKRSGLNFVSVSIIIGISTPSFPISILDASLYLIASNHSPDVIPVLLHLESLHTILDHIQTLCHVQWDEEHAVLVSKVSAVRVDEARVLDVDQGCWARSKTLSSDGGRNMGILHTYHRQCNCLHSSLATSGLV